MSAAAELFNKIRKNYPSVELDFIQRAYDFSEKAHINQKRASGEPYFLHPLAVAHILADLKLDPHSVVTGLLHDTIEDTDVTERDVQDVFGPEILQLVKGVTKLTRIEEQSEHTQQAENFKKLLSATEESQQKLLRKQFATDVKKHIDDISKKYIRPGEGTFDFALMYIPAENVYYEIIAKDHETNESKPLVAYAMEKHVIAVSPNTFYAYLNTILLGLKGMRVERFAKDILKDMERIRTEVNRFTAEFTTIGTHIAHANSAYTKAEKRIGRIDERLSSFSSSHQGVESFPAAETLPLQP